MTTEIQSATSLAPTKGPSLETVATPTTETKRQVPEENSSSSSSIRKRKASPSTSPPRPKQDTKRAKQQESLSERQRRASKEEEKSRGRRLFGGLLSTLAGGGGGGGGGGGAGGSTNHSNHHDNGATLQQQKRRQEIERRQLDKIQQQTVESDKLRAEKRASLTKIRLERQIVWEEQVMKSRHAKELKLARFLRTESKPEICFLPWKLTRDEEDTIAKQVGDCKDRIATELQDFDRRREQHRKRYAPPAEDETATQDVNDNKSVSSKPVNIKKDESQPEAEEDGPKVEPSSVDPPPPPSSSPPVKAKPEAKAEAGAEQDSHDDSGDILVEADEDMVIY